MATVNEIKKELDETKERLDEAVEELKEFKNEGKVMRLNKLKMGEVEERYVKEKELKKDKQVWGEQVRYLQKELTKFNKGKGNEQIT